MLTLITPRNLTEILMYVSYDDNSTKKYRSPDSDVVIWFVNNQPIGANSNKKSLADVAEEIAEFLYEGKSEKKI